MMPTYEVRRRKVINRTDSWQPNDEPVYSTLDLWSQGSIRIKLMPDRMTTWQGSKPIKGFDLWTDYRNYKSFIYAKDWERAWVTISRVEIDPGIHERIQDRNGKVCSWFSVVRATPENSVEKPFLMILDDRVSFRYLDDFWISPNQLWKPH